MLKPDDKPNWQPFHPFEIDHDSPQPSERLLGERPVYSDAKRASLEVEEDQEELLRLMVEQAGPSVLLSQDQRSRNKRWIVFPDSTFRMVWVQCQLVIAMYIIWVTPVRVGFDLPAQGAWFWVEGLIDLFFYADLAMNFFTAYEDASGELVTSHKRIADRYLRTWFAVDFLATFPVDYIVRALEGTWECSAKGNCHDYLVGDTNVDILRIFKAARIFRIVWIFKHFKKIRIAELLGRLQDELFAVMPVVTILELLVILLYLGHISGCFFYYFSSPKWWSKEEKEVIDSGEMMTWMQHSFGGSEMLMIPDHLNMTAGQALPPNTMQDPKSKLWYQCPEMGYDIIQCNTCIGPHVRCYSHYRLFFRYITSMYWAYTTMTTVGYGDIAAVTVAEKIWAIIVMVMSGFFFSFVVGRMASVVARIDTRKQEYDKQMEEVGIFLRDTNLPRHLSKRVMHHFKTQRYKGYDPQHVLSRLPFELKSKLLRQMYAATIRHVPLLQKQADDDLFVTDVCIRLQEYSCASETFVYQRGEVGGDVFVLLHGELLVLDLDQTTPLYHVGEGAVFGEEVLLRHLQGFEHAKRTENVWCRTSCRMLRIAREDMLDLLAQYPALLQNMKKLHRARQYNLQQARKTTKEQDVTAPSTALPSARSAAAASTAASAQQQEGSLRKLIKRASFSKSTPNLKQLAYSSLGDHPFHAAPTPHQHHDHAEDAMLIDIDDMPQSGSPRAVSSPMLAAFQPESSALPAEGSTSAAAPELASARLSRVLSKSNMLPARATAPAGLPPRRMTDTGAYAGSVVGGPSYEALLEDVAQLRQLISEQQQFWIDELQYQRYLIHQVPGRVMNHLVMVMGQPTEEQRKKLEQATLAWNDKNRWRI